MERLLITGAAGRLGEILRAGLSGYARTLRLSDIREMLPATTGEEVVACDLRNREAVAELAKGCDGVVHLGAIPTEAPFDDLLSANFVGTYNVYEAARVAGCRRVLFASTNHVTGYYPQSPRIDTATPVRPDSLYGVSKCFGEALSRYYFDKFNLESVCVRIGYCAPEPRNRRHLAIWLSPSDFIRLTKAVFDASFTGHTIVYGASDNTAGWWSNDPASPLNWKPRDSSDRFRERIEAAFANVDPSIHFQGGAYTRRGTR